MIKQTIVTAPGSAGGVFLKTAQEPGSLGRFHFRYVLLKLEGHFKIAVLSGGVLKRLLPILQREQTADNPFGFQVAVGDVLDNNCLLYTSPSPRDTR